MFRSTKPSRIRLQFLVRPLSSNRLLRIAPCVLRDGIPPQTVKSHRNAANPFRICTCKSASKQRTLTSFRMNTYAKTGGGGGPGGARARPLPKLVIPRAPRDLLVAVRRKLASHYSLPPSTNHCFSETTPLCNRQTTQRASVPRRCLSGRNS